MCEGEDFLTRMTMKDHPPSKRKSEMVEVRGLVEAQLPEGRSEHDLVGALQQPQPLHLHWLGHVVRIEHSIAVSVGRLLSSLVEMMMRRR